MTTDPTEAAPDLAMLSQRHPGWFFCFITTGTKRLIAASLHGVKVIDETPGAVSAKIRREEDRDALAP